MSRETLFNLRPYFTGLSSWRGILSEGVCSSVFLCVCVGCQVSAGEVQDGVTVTMGVWWGGGFMVGQTLAGFQRSCCKT